MHTPRFPVPFARWLSLACLLLTLGAGILPLRADETIRQVQEELRKRSLYFGDIDGRPSPEVSAALRNYQKRKGFDPSGEPDDTTLRSLRLLPALAARAAGPPSDPDPDPAPVASPWPDITVLRSDEARRAPTPDAAAIIAAEPLATAQPTPTPGPGPAAATRHRPTPDEARAFIERYLQAGQANDAPGELAFYADHVDYFDEGLTDRPSLEAKVDHYDRRWPQRRFTLLGPVTVSDTADGDPDKAVAHFRYAFVNKGPRYTVEGKVDNDFTLERNGPDSFRILGTKEQRVRER